MAVDIQFVDNQPILIVIGTAPLVAQDALDTLDAANKLKAQFPGKKIYRVMDFTRGIDFSGMMVCMATEAGKLGGSNDPDVESYFVGSSELVQLGVKALKEQEQYGQAPNVKLFLSFEEAKALAFANSSK